MRIPRVIRRKPAFRRRSSPPPAARKLLIASLTAGLVLLAMLAIVFALSNASTTAFWLVPAWFNTTS